MTQLVQPFSRPEPKRDRWGRYVLPHPMSGKEEAWTRATTFAKTISDMYGLGQWQQRMVAKGLAERHDLYALAASTSVEDKTKFDRICEDAKEAAAASSGANLGTALHAFTERVDAGEEVRAPAPWDRDIAAYRAKLIQAGIIVHPEWIERIVVFPEMRIAGTLDRILSLRDGRRVIGDVKTGKDLGYSWGEIAIQLGIYANATHMWDHTANRYFTMPPVDQAHAIVIHLPVGQGIAELYEVDIAEGLRGMLLARDVRDWRSAAKKLAHVYSPGFPTLLEQVAAAPDRKTLEALWSTADAAGQWTREHTAAASQRAAQLQTSVA